MLTRVVRRQPVANAVGGLVGVGIAVLIALATGGAEGYFLPRVVLNAAWALAFLVSIVVRRPAVGIFAQLVHGMPEDWLANPPVRRAFTEATVIYQVVYYAGKAIVYGVLIEAASSGRSRRCRSCSAGRCSSACSPSPTSTCAGGSSASATRRP